MSRDHAADGVKPPHHGPDGYRNPWRLGPEPPRATSDLLKWMWQRSRTERAPNPSPDELPRLAPDMAVPRLSPGGGIRITWVGHCTFLIQLPGLNVLTDPIFSRRASPVQWAGPKRFSPPGLTLDDLPPVDAVVLSHDHYDHLDRRTVLGLQARFGAGITWLTPLGYRVWLGRRGVERVAELDWWQDRHVDGESGRATFRCLPARHWTRRRLFDARRRLWCAWSMELDGHRVYFGGDSGYGPAFQEIGRRAGPFDVALLPIGAYEPRWFMKPSHMNPEEAAQACRDVDAAALVAMHWGTFRLTDEPPLEPPARLRAAWSHLGLDPSNLYVPALGETLTF